MRGRKRNFRSVIVSGEKASVFLAAAFIFISAFCITRTNLSPAEFHSASMGLSVPVFMGESDLMPKPHFLLNYYGILSDNIPSIRANSEMQKKYMAMFTGSIKAKKEKTQPDAVTEESGLVKEVNSSGGMSINNASEYQLNVNELLAEGFSMDVKGNEPKILIISTHSSEAYSNSAGGRSEDENQNVLKVGEVLAKTLNDAGIKTIHDKTRNDFPSYNGSYKKALSVIEGNIQKYPSIEMVIDVHRDYMETAEGVRLKPTAVFGGKNKAAQIMFVMGTDSMGLEHPNWRENLRLAVKLQSLLNEDAPGLCRSINVRTERFNQHVARGSMIVEFGSCENTLAEAMYSAELLGKAIIKAFK